MAPSASSAASVCLPAPLDHMPLKPEHEARSREITPPPARFIVARGGGVRPSRLLLWALSSAGWILVMSFIGRRTTIHALLCFPPVHFFVLVLVTRVAALCSARLRRQVQLSARSCVLGQGWGDETYRAVGWLLALATMGEVVAVGRLELGLALALQTLLAPLIFLLSPYFDLPTPSLLSPSGLAIIIGPLLAGMGSSAAVPSGTDLLCGLVGLAAQAGLCCVLARMWSDGAVTATAILWHAAPIAIVISGAVCAFNLLLHAPLATSLYPPPAFLLCLMFTSLLNFVTLGLALGVLYESGPSVLSSALTTVPRGLLVSLVAAVGGLSGANESPQRAAFALGTAVVAWAQLSARTGNEAEDSEKGWSSPRRQSSMPPASLTGDFSPRLRSSPPESPRRTSFGSIERNPLLPISFLSLLPFLPFLPVLLQAITPFPPLPHLPTQRLPPYLANRIGLYHRAQSHFQPPTLDIVFAHYGETVDAFDKHVQHVRGKVRRHKTRVSVYTKGGADPEELRGIEGVDEVIELPNLGREGGTYLHHIIRRFEKPSPEDAFGGTDGHETSHADLTLFLQHHLAWSWIADQRFDFVDDRTGFLALGPWVKSDCGHDLRVDARFERMKDIYVLFQEDFCPPTLQLSAWAAQFFVSRKRIVANSRRKYERLLELLQAPQEHWLYTEGAHFKWNGTMGPSNPYLGHALERSWPVIFNCTDPRIADTCPDDKYDAASCVCPD
ncbi:hypothetical protein JCM10213_006930 [Rhodosporidiobolus nylandii]